MKVSELSEFRIIELLSRIIAAEGADKTDKELPLLGIGDDATAWYRSNSIELATTDMLIEGVHFRPETTTWHELGWKALAVNLSDIAAMGGIPQYALVTLSFPADTEFISLEELYRGMAQAARKFNTAIIGGDTNRSPLLSINIALIGISSHKEGGLLTRAAALPGDLIAVTGYLGLSSAGLKMLQNNLSFDKETTNLLRKAHNQPEPRVKEGQLLLQHEVRAAIDISDGLIQDLSHICQASNVGAQIMMDRIPIHPLMQSAFGSDSMSLALSGGEDYELLFTAPPDIMIPLKKSISCPITIIGEIISDKPGQVDLINADGKIINRNNEDGWDHFATGNKANDD